MISRGRMVLEFGIRISFGIAFQASNLYCHLIPETLSGTRIRRLADSNLRPPW